jgi:hypothetical protein
LTILIDDEKHDSKVSKGQSVMIPISYGFHSIYARLGSSQSETLNFVVDTFSEPLVFIAIAEGRLFYKKNVSLSQRVITDETWWPKMAANNMIDWRHL